MPNSAVTVEVTFTSAPYWYDGYYYDYETGTYRRYYGDDYYYYRSRRDKEAEEAYHRQTLRTAHDSAIFERQDRKRTFLGRAEQRHAAVAQSYFRDCISPYP